MDKQKPKLPFSKAKRKTRKLSTSSINFELESIREHHNEQDPLNNRLNNPNISQLRSEDSFLRLLPVQRSESDINFPPEEEPEKNLSIVERDEGMRFKESNQNLRHILDRGLQSKQSGRYENLKSQSNSEQQSVKEDKQGELENDEGSKFVKIYEPKNFFKTAPDNKMLLLYPFILSKHYVDSVRLSNLFTQSQNLKSQTTDSGFPQFKSHTSEKPQKKSEFSEILSETQKCKKISKKLKRAWNLNHQIPQNVFKKVTILYKSKENSRESDFDDDSESFQRESILINQENNENERNRLNSQISGNLVRDKNYQKTGKKKRITKKKKSKFESESLKTGRSLRKTTWIKKKKENDRLIQQAKAKERRSKNFNWNSMENLGMNLGSGFKKFVKPNLVRDKRKLEIVEFLDYANKNIRKKKKHQENENDDDQEEY